MTEREPQLPQPDAARGAASKRLETEQDEAAREGPTAESKAAEDEGPDEHDTPQEAWAARRDLLDHSPRTMNVGARSRFDGGLVGGDQHGVSGGQVTGDVIMGSKTTTFHYHLGISATAHVSGEVPQATLDRLAENFVIEETFHELAELLRRDRVLVLSGARFSGRRTAALMLLRRIGALPIRTMVRDITPGALVKEIAREGGAHGYVLCDLATGRGEPLREPHLLEARTRLAENNAFMVITLGSDAVIEDVTPHAWRPPPTAEVLAAHLRTAVGEATAAKLLELPAVTEFLARRHQLREAAAFARELAGYAAGQVDEATVEGFSLAVLEEQVREWFETDEIQLRDKAFLVALAAFHGGPYALTAELSDLLYRLLQETENRSHIPVVPVFGTHSGKRLQLARAITYEEDEATEWGPVVQRKAAYEDERASLILLREVWTGHPSARPALVRWLSHLAGDGRPLVRTRAASTAAVLARADLPSAMALVIEPWATSNLFRYRLVAVNALSLSNLVGTPNIRRILDNWCTEEDKRLAWVAVRAYALIGPECPEQAMAALRGTARRLRQSEADSGTHDEEMRHELAEAVELLLLSTAHEEVLAEVHRAADEKEDAAVRDLALGGFVRACHRTEDDQPHGTPLLLASYARASTKRAPAAFHIPALWRAALGHRRHTRDALTALRQWVLVADRNPAVECTLTRLLPTLVTTPAEHERVAHLLRTLPGEDGPTPPSVAARLLASLQSG